MASNFPATSIDSFTAKVDSTDYPTAAHVNDLQNAVVAVQTKVGINASGTNTTVDYKLSTLAAGEKAVDIGDIKMTGRATAPTGWMLCDGTAISRTTYSALFTAVSTAFGVGDGTTTFNVPDLRDRFPMGKSGTKALGSTGGASTATLTTTELPAHTHTGTSHTHTGTTDNDSPDHSHSIPWAASNNSGTGGGGPDGGGTNSGGASARHTHTFTTAAGGTGATGSTGSGTAFSILNPYQVVNFVIKF